MSEQTFSFMETSNWICPNCGGSPVKGLVAKDGGSAVCSECRTLFHYCEVIADFATTRPLDCCLSSHTHRRKEW